MTKRILVFSLVAPPLRVGGAELAMQEVIDRSIESQGSNFEFDLVTIRFDSQLPPYERKGKLTIYRVGWGKNQPDIADLWRFPLSGNKYLFPWLAASLAKKLARERKYDLVWSIMANQAGIAGAWFKKSHPEIPFLLTLQEGDDLDSLAYRARLLLPKIFGVFTRANHIQAISNYLANWARTKMRATCPVTVIPNGVDVNSFKLLAVSEEQKLEKIVITTSRLVYKNGVDVLIKALALLPGDVKLWIVGEGPEKASLVSLAESLGLAARVSFLGQVASSVVGQYLAKATIFARPARSEGLGNSFLEAMAAGLPVIGTPVGGIPDFLKQHETGWLCEVDNPTSVATQVKFILEPENQREVEKIISNAKKLVIENYDWGKLVVKFNELFYKLTT